MIIERSAAGKTNYDAYRTRNYLSVGGWIGPWLSLELFGLLAALFLLIPQKARHYHLDNQAQMKLVTGFFLGVVCGMLTLGIRYAPVMPPIYFWSVAGLLVLLGGVFLVWKKRQHRPEELFP